MEEIKCPNNDLKTSVIYPIYLVSKEIIRKYNVLLSEYDITYTQYLVMNYFFHEKKSNLKKIGKSLMLDSSTLTPLLKKLEKKGFIVREKSTVDERNLFISVTDEGLALKPKLKKVRKEIQKICDLSEDEVNSIHTIMFKLLNTIIKENENGNRKSK